MKTFYVIALLASEASVAVAQCNADNVLRALRVNQASASPFCSTYTLPPPNQPLPTYVSQYPALRVSSGCSCLITPGPTTLTTSTTSASSSSEPSTTTTTTSATPTYTPGVRQCSGELIRNGGFQTVINRIEAPPWAFLPPYEEPTGQTSGAYLVTGADGINYASLRVDNKGYGGDRSTYITQPIPSLCKYVYYTLSYDATTTVIDGQMGAECSLEITLIGGYESYELVYNGPYGEILPFGYQRRSYTFMYSGNTDPQTLKVRFRCRAPSGSFTIDNISLIGKGENS
ncbi:MAG: hypothetical protein Q9184_006766 [Pyrenodesmia sp. 2 TL-2023]